MGFFEFLLKSSAAPFTGPIQLLDKKQRDTTVALGKSFVEAPVKLAKRQYYTEREKQAKKFYDKGQLSSDKYRAILQESAKGVEKTGIGMNDSFFTTLRKQTGDVASTVLTGLPASGAAKAIKTGTIPTVIKGATTGAKYGGAFGAVNTLSQETATPQDFLENIISGGVMGGVIGGGAPLVFKGGQKVRADLADNEVGAKQASLFGKPEQHEIASHTAQGAKGASNVLNLSQNPTQSAVDKGAVNIADDLIEKGKLFDVKTPQAIAKKFSENPQAAVAPASKYDWLRNLQRTRTAMSTFYGKTGGDITESLARGAKTIADIQNATHDDVSASLKLLKKLSGGRKGSEIGRNQIEDRVNKALQDRGNAEKYLQGRTPKETEQLQELYIRTEKVYDTMKKFMQDAGRPVRADYSPRTIQKQLVEGEDILYNAEQAFNSDVASRFAQRRTKEVPLPDVDKNVVSLLPRYISSVSKDLAYKDRIPVISTALQEVNPVFRTNPRTNKQADQYVGTLLKDVINPEATTTAERLSSKALATTYVNQLGYNPRFILTNRTQRILNKARISKEGAKLAKELPEDVRGILRQNTSSTMTPITGELDVTPEGILNKPRRFSGQGVEEKNIIDAMNKGAADAIARSPQYKANIAKGMSRGDAARAAMVNPEVKDLAIRGGNVLINDVQVGGNFVDKAEFFRKKGSVLGVPMNFIKQYKQFQSVMGERLIEIARPTEARAINILTRGNPKETQIVDFYRAAQGLKRMSDDLVKGVEYGYVKDIPLDFAKQYQKQVNAKVGELQKAIKDISPINSAKSAKKFTKMWLAASAVQFLFDGGLDVAESLSRSAPVNVPARNESPTTSALLPASLPKAKYDIKRKLLNFVPVVGLAVNRGRDISKAASGFGRFLNALGGE